MFVPHRTTRWRASFSGSAAVVAVAALSLTPRLAKADDPQWDKQIKIESDFRFRLEDKSIGNKFTERTLGAGVERNQNILSTKLGVSWENFKVVAQADLVLYGYRNEISRGWPRSTSK